jgi:hypothetical protein
MPSYTDQTITEGFPVGNAWTIGNLDQDLVNLSIARFVSLATSQSGKINSQVQTLLAQATNLEAMKDKSAALPTDYLVPFASDQNGNVLISDPLVVYDLVGATVSQLASSASDVDRLINFTQGLANNSTNLNLGDSVVYKVSYTVPGGNGSGAFNATGYFETTIIDPGTDTSTLAANHLYKVSGSDKFYLNVTVQGGATKVASVGSASVASPVPSYVGFDAYRIDVKNSAGIWESRVMAATSYVDLAVNPKPSVDTLYRWPDGTVKVINPSGQVLESRNEVGFVIPASDSQITNWLGQASFDKLQAKLKEIAADGVTFDLTNKTTIQWTSSDSSATGFAKFPAKSFSTLDDLKNDSSLKVGELASVGSTDVKYFVKSGTGSGLATFSQVTLDPAKAFQLIATSQDLMSLKGAYADLILKLTQRSSEQQLFLNQMINQQNYQFDSATFVLKALTEMQQKLANI